MDEELDPADENVNSILAQEYSELLSILRCQSDSVIMHLCQTMPSDAVILNKEPTIGSATAPDHIKAMLEYFTHANPAECCNFLQRVCLLCEDIPMHLESKLMSVAGYANGTSSVTDWQPLMPPAEEQLIKRPRIDYWEQYKTEVASFLQRRWKRMSEGLVKDTQPDKVWVSIKTANRARDRPDQTPSSEWLPPDCDYGCPESRLTLESFLQGCAGKVTVLCGQPGSGKTVLMSSLGQQWGPIPSSHLFVLLEFRQLNLLSSPLSLSELLFHHYLPMNGDNDQAIVDYLISNPEQSCWVLDGYDEFHKKLKKQKVQNEPLDSEKPLHVAELISGLLNRRLLAGSSVLVTCRLRDVIDLDGLPDKVGQLLPWDHQEIKEYIKSFFDLKGNLGPDAAGILFSNRHLLAMSSLAALCYICCVFLQNLLPQIPATQTQIYLAAVGAFLSRYPHLYSAELCELSQLAWRGVEESRIIFLEEDVPRHILDLSIKTGLFSQVEFRSQGGFLASAYCFVHLTVQEFLAALRIMTSSDVSDADLKKRFSLKTRWTTKSDQKTVFTDSLYLYVCGLASSDCTPALVLVAKAAGIKGAQNWVQKRQALVLKLLKALCHSAALTGPKILQLCHCVQESQNQQLAQQVVSVRPTLELRNFWLLPSDIDALAFVVNSVNNTGVGLDFGACSMELECLDALSQCQYLHFLSFRSRKYGDKFAEKLSSILPRFTALRKLEFCGASLTAAGAASLASGLQCCPSITELNFSDNNLQNEGIRHIADVLAKLQNLVSVKYVALKLYLNIKVVDYSCFYLLIFCAGWDEITLP
uniref:NACHT domain-containing protein n=1 Tax=Cyprinodon variegatus TaxID=28743 RepID=A0A3Q2CZE1_CYPVA